MLCVSWDAPSAFVPDNAGVMATPYQKTKDGYEMQFGVVGPVQYECRPVVSEQEWIEPPWTLFADQSTAGHPEGVQAISHHQRQLFRSSHE